MSQIRLCVPVDYGGEHFEPGLYIIDGQIKKDWLTKSRLWEQWRDDGVWYPMTDRAQEVLEAVAMSDKCGLCYEDEGCMTRDNDGCAWKEPNGEQRSIGMATEAVVKAHTDMGYAPVVSDGGSSEYYDFPKGATRLQDVLVNMSWNQANIMKAAYRWEQKPDLEYNLRKIRWFLEEEYKRQGMEWK